MNTLPVSKQELAIMLAGMKDLEIYYGNDGKWSQASRTSRIHAKLLVNLNRYEEIDEDEE